MNENPTNPVEQYELGKKYEEGDGFPKNMETSIFWYTKAAYQGYAPAQYKLGMIYHNEYGIREKAIVWLKQAADNKVADKSCALAADELWKAYNYEYDFGDVRKWSDYRLGSDKALDKEKALCYWERAINLFEKLGDAESKFRLYELYKDGFSGTVAGTDLRIEEFHREPSRYIEKVGKCLIEAAGQGHADALWYLGKALLLGNDSIGILKDEMAAAEMLNRAAKQGHAYAEDSLGDCYANGTGVLKDLEKAVYWYTQAAEHGNRDTQYKLGKMYANGENVTQDLEKAKHYIALAAEGGYNKQAKKALAKLNKGATSIKDGGCYVATCVYDSYDCPEVWTLRRYRDGKLSKSWLGRRFIRFYYAVSPKIVELFGNRKWFNGVCKPVLNKIVRTLQNRGIDCGYYSEM